ncbi:MAG: hypothetical protein ABS68_11235 [Niastella sp. SCN 39-18]|nr:hypothetical protein [Sphingobacteriales bacterium]ODT51950.1 MAG: hypothetical protein ABS68_11235 [Niastella sp. SCN 39-18]OJW11506.1 MAG: hypothetical protein BGO53_11245 [Sphingobacteriales bacterium 39-19]
MKKQFLMLAAALLLGITSLFAQQNYQRQTPEERTKATMEKLGPLNLTEEQTPKVSAIFLASYQAQEKSMEEMRASGSFDRDAMRAKRTELNDSRDKALKAILTEEQMKKWKDEVEPSLRPQRRGQ